MKNLKFNLKAYLVVHKIYVYIWYNIIVYKFSQYMNVITLYDI